LKGQLGERPLGTAWWRDRIVLQTHQPAHFERFIDFVKEPAPDGLGTDLETLRGFCKNDIEATQLLATVAEPLARHGEIGRGRNRDRRSTSNGKRDATYLTDRIARDHPDILERMKAGEFKSVKAAAREASIIKKTFTIPAEPKAAAAALRGNTPPA